MSPEERIKKLEKQVAELLEWKRQRMSQQITFPLDKTSQDVIGQNFIYTNGNTVAPVSLLGSSSALEVKVGGITYWLLASPQP